MFYSILGAVSLNCTIYLLMSYPLSASLVVAWLPLSLTIACVYEMITAK
jgi:hypothetical protein